MIRNKMKKQKNLATRNKEISSNIMEAIYLTDALSELTEYEGKTSVLIRAIKKHLTHAFKEIETCRKIV